MASQQGEKYRNLFNERNFMKEITTSIDDAAAIIRAILIRIFTGKSEISPKQWNTSLDVSQTHA